MSSSSSVLVERVPKLYDFLSIDDIDSIQKHFKQQKAGLSYEKFRGLLERFSITYADEAFHNVCLKIDLDRDNAINWSEFIAYFILELQNDDNVKERLSIIPPIERAANVLSTVQRSNVLRIQFVHDENWNRAEGDKDGGYVTIGCFGELNFWTSKWKLETTSSAGKTC